MRIFFYAPHPHRTAKPELAILQAAGHDVQAQSLATFRGEALPDLAEYHVRRDLPEALPRTGHVADHLVTRARVYTDRQRARTRAVRELRPDVAHLQHLEPTIDAWERGTFGRVPVVVMLHDVVRHHTRIADGLDHRLMERVLQRSSGVLVYHESIRDHAVATYHLDPDRVHVCPHPMVADVADVEPGAGVDRPVRLLLYGSLRENKGFSVLREALAQLRESGDLDAFEVVVAGDGPGPLRAEVEAAAADGLLRAELGWVSEARQRELLVWSDAAVLPYTSFQSQSGVLAAAYGAGRAVIVSDVGAIGPTVRADGSGWVVPPGDPGALADQLRGVAARPAEIAAACDRAKARLPAHGPQAVADAHLAAFEAATARPAGGAGDEAATGSRRFTVAPAAVTKVFSRTWDHPANADRRVAAVASLAARELQTRVTGRPVVVRIGEHSRILARHHEDQSWEIVRANPPDHAEMLFWSRHLRPGSLFVDVGAHVGLYTLWALDRGATAIAAEPSAVMLDKVRANLELNGYHAELVAAALADRPGRMRFAGPDRSRAHLVFDDGRAEPDDEGEEVEVRTLDEVLGDRTADGVKIDVEGAERLVLEGAERALAEHRIAVIQLEWNDCSEGLLGQDREPVAKLLHEAGYVLWRPTDDGRVEPVADHAYGRDMFASPRSLPGTGSASA